MSCSGLVDKLVEVGPLRNKAQAKGMRNPTLLRLLFSFKFPGSTETIRWTMLAKGQLENGRSTTRSGQTTRWSVVLRAIGEGNDAVDALQELCLIYWPILHAYARRYGCNDEEAKDMTQQFVASIIEGNLLENADPERGRFRSFLLTCMKNMLTNEWRKSTATKRGGGQAALQFDEEEAEVVDCHGRGYHQLEPDHLFDRRWAELLVDRSVARLRDEWENAGKPFDALKAYLTDTRGDLPTPELARSLGCTEAALVTSIHRMRRRYGEIFREEVAHTVADSAEVDGEIRHLLSILGG